MANNLTFLELIPVPDVRRPAKLTLLPRWVAERLDSLKKAEMPDASGKYRETPVLPPALIPTTEQKAAIGRHLGSLAELFEMTPENRPELGSKMTEAVTKMVMTLAGREMGEFAAMAKGEAYTAALEDVAVWAVEAAARRWYRGECGDRDYRWPPDPATLRELARLEEFRVRAAVRRLRELLEAKPAIEVDPERAAAMRKQLTAIGLDVEASP